MLFVAYQIIKLFESKKAAGNSHHAPPYLQINKPNVPLENDLQGKLKLSASLFGKVLTEVRIRDACVWSPAVDVI